VLATCRPLAPCWKYALAAGVDVGDLADRRYGLALARHAAAVTAAAAQEWALTARPVFNTDERASTASCAKPCRTTSCCPSCRWCASASPTTRRRCATGTSCWARSTSPSRSAAPTAACWRRSTSTPTATRRAARGADQAGRAGRLPRALPALPGRPPALDSRTAAAGAAGSSQTRGPQPAPTMNQARDSLSRRWPAGAASAMRCGRTRASSTTPSSAPTPAATTGRPSDFGALRSTLPLRDLAAPGDPLAAALRRRATAGPTLTIDAPLPGYLELTPAGLLDALDAVGLRPTGAAAAQLLREPRAPGVPGRRQRGGHQVLPARPLERRADPRGARLRARAGRGRGAGGGAAGAAGGTKRRHCSCWANRRRWRAGNARASVHRFSVSPRCAGREPELEQPDTLRRSAASSAGCTRWAGASPSSTATAWTPRRDGQRALTAAGLRLRDRRRGAGLAATPASGAGRGGRGLRPPRPAATLRLHGDCHLGNVLWRDGPACGRPRRRLHGPGGAGPVDAGVGRRRHDGGAARLLLEGYEEWSATSTTANGG
jgi:hypothetical protein